MNRSLVTTLAGATLIALAAPVAAQSLAARVSAAPSNGMVHFSYESKVGVCGDGETIMIRRDGESTSVFQQHGSSYTMSNGRGNREPQRCDEGPVVVQLTRNAGRVTDARVSVGGAPVSGGTDLGTATPQAAVDYLLTVGVEAADSKPADRMVFAATLAAAESWPQLLALARKRDVATRPRSSATFWLAQAAGDKATAGLTSLVGDDSDEIEVRESAIFALTQIKSVDSVSSLMDIARSNREPKLRRTAMFWLGQSKDPRVLSFFEEILKG